MPFLKRLKRSIFGSPIQEEGSRKWEPDGVTKEEILNLFARELQRYKKTKNAES